MHSPDNALFEWTKARHNEIEVIDQRLSTLRGVHKRRDMSRNQNRSVDGSGLHAFEMRTRGMLLLPTKTIAQADMGDPRENETLVRELTMRLSIAKAKLHGKRCVPRADESYQRGSSQARSPSRVETAGTSWTTISTPLTTWKLGIASTMTRIVSRTPRQPETDSSDAFRALILLSLALQAHPSSIWSPR